MSDKKPVAKANNSSNAGTQSTAPTGAALLSPTALSGHLACPHLTVLERARASGELERPAHHNSYADELRQRGEAHEIAYLNHLRATGLNVAEPHAASAEETLKHMQAGVEVIYQASLSDAGWHGRADFLLKVGSPSELGNWSYEVQDTKLARETRAGTLLQLCVYSELLGRLQGRAPEHMHVIAPARDFAPDTYRFNDFAAYYRQAKRRLAEFSPAPGGTYPKPVEHCDLCAWWPQCNTRRRTDDHLCFVAGLTTGQAEALHEMSLHTLAGFAEASDADIVRPSRGSREVLQRLREQASIQHRARRQNARLHTLHKPIDAAHGFCRLPEPTPDDVYLDFEGSHFAENGVQEYLTGFVQFTSDETFHYTGWWARSLAEEKANFEQFIDFALHTRRRNLAAHIYHFGAYEPAALKRMMGRFATREVELDELLRGEAFVDLHAVLKRTLIASVERYSIKDLEPFFGFQREQDLRDASASRRAIEAALECDGEISAHHLTAVEAYNREDCVSTQRLQNWLESLRATELASGKDIPRPLPASGEASENITDLEGRIRELRDALLANVPEDAETRTPEETAMYLLAHSMEFHRREEKATWWEAFRLQNLQINQYLYERRAASGLLFERVLNAGAAPLLQFRFTAQDLDARKGDSVYEQDGTQIGSVADLDFGTRCLDIKMRKDARDRRPSAVYFHKAVGAGAIRDSLLRFGEHVRNHGLIPGTPYAPALNLLQRQRPFQSSPVAGDLLQSGDDPLACAKRLALWADGEVIAIQGPPGTGKTYTGAHIICELVRAGKTIGVTAISHRVILNLLEKACELAANEGAPLRVAHKPASGVKAYTGDHPIQYAGYPALLAGLGNGSINVVGGTAWAWSRVDFEQAVDVLIVDEAGQMALANTLAVAPAARSLILLGDPQQLEQPLQASHPSGTEVSALKHWLGGAQTMPADRGLFLDTTWRLHPGICAFTSEVYYEGRMSSREASRQMHLDGLGAWQGSGLRYLPVEHTGNTAQCPQEVQAINALVEELLSAGTTWVDSEGASRELTANDLLIVAPYNAQVAALTAGVARLKGRIGTVDKFQGQEAAVVIYSMTSSTPQDAPRGMSFLYDPHRFNVATSRAKVLCVLVGSPALFDPQCKSPAQMKMASAFCRYLEFSSAQSATI